MSEHNRQCGSQPDANPEQQHSEALGPWNADGITYPDGYFFESHVMDGRSVVAFARSMNEGTCKRIAHMAAAAPAMYVALNEALEALDNYSDIDGQGRPNMAMRAYEVVKAAILKAEGSAA